MTANATQRREAEVEPSLTKIFGWIVVSTLTPVFRPFATQTPTSFFLRLLYRLSADQFLHMQGLLSGGVLPILDDVVELLR